MSEPVLEQFNSNVVRNYQTAEYGKFVELIDSRFPPISVIRTASPGNEASLDIYPKYGVLSYITNFSDMAVTLSAGDVEIGGVEIKDWNSNTRADVVADEGYNALRVLSQDLESAVDDITIGDKVGNFATIQPTYSALRTYPVVQSGGYTFCETRTAGNPSFIPGQIIIHNGANSFADVTLTLTSGMSCRISVGKHGESNHVVILNLAVSAVNVYGGCEITFFG